MSIRFPTLGEVTRHRAETLQITSGDFIRLFLIRQPNWMWFLGAGASAGADVPTAGNMIWDFKRLIYRTAEGVPPQMVEDLTNPAVRVRIQRYFDAKRSNPADGSEEEYAHYFEAAYPTEADRRAYIDGKTANSRPAFGHLGLAALMKAGYVKAVWETNFDALVEDACAEIFWHHCGTDDRFSRWERHRAPGDRRGTLAIVGQAPW